MKKYFYVTLALLFLAGCSEQPSVESLIKSNLRDPDSAKFRNFIISKHKSMACIDWNARNSLGGYGEWDTARLVNEGKSWSIVKMQTSTKDYAYWCPQNKMDAHEATQEIVKDFLKEADQVKTTDSAIDKESADTAVEVSAKPEINDSTEVDKAAAEAQALVDAAMEAARSN